MKIAITSGWLNENFYIHFSNWEKKMKNKKTKAIYYVNKIVSKSLSKRHEAKWIFAKAWKLFFESGINFDNSIKNIMIIILLVSTWPERDNLISYEIVTNYLLIYYLSSYRLKK